MSETLAVPGLEVAWATHKGCVRERNEDAIGVVPLPEEGGVLLVVCDGMGGHAGGEVASRIACDRLLEAAPALSSERPLIERFDALLSALYEADQKVREAAAADPRLRGMGTTAVVAAVTPRAALHLHIGDSRLYHFRGGQRLYRTQDHSVVELLRQMGQLDESEMPGHPGRHLLLASLGGGDPKAQLDVAPKWQEGAGKQEAERAPLPGDLVLLCTDGLNGALGEEALAGILRAGGDRSIVELVDRLVEAGLQARGEDNITVALARVGSKGRQPGTNTGEAAIVAANSVRWPEPASRPVLGISPEPSRGGDRHA